MTKSFKQKISNRIVLGKSIIDQAGLGAEVEILVQEGAVLILPSIKPKGWKVWESMGKVGKINTRDEEIYMRILLVRNAEHIGEEKHFWADKEIGLSKNGKKQAQLLCRRLERENPNAIYSSDFIRAIETVEPSAEKLGLKIVRDPVFRSFDVGKWFGKTEQETIKTLGKETWQEILTNPDPDKRYFEGGETLQEETKRSWSGLETILKKHSPDSTVIISTHLTIIACLLCRMLEIPLNKVWFWGGSMAADHPSITIVVFRKGTWFLEHYGCAEHLTEESFLGGKVGSLEVEESASK